MKEFWSARIRDVVPYTPGEQPRSRAFIKLNTNENPYPPSKKAVAAIKKAADTSLRLYPDPECTELCRAIAYRYGFSPSQVFAGNGSDEVLAFCFQAFFDPGRPVLFPDITYSFYQVYVNFFGLSARTVPLDENFDLPVEAFFGAPGGVVIANPNAPTGKAVSMAEIRRILEENPGVVVLVDEAYVDFGAETCISLITEFSNLLVVRTVSKSRSLAGLRVGVAIGHPNLMNALRCVRDSINSYTVGRLAQAGATAAVEDAGHFVENVEKIIKTRAWVTDRLRGLGFLVHDSSANFIFIRHEKRTARVLLEDLREAGILVRHFDAPRIDDYLRVTIGTDADMEVFCRTAEDLLTHAAAEKR